MGTSECFMPLAYGGGVKSMEHAARLFTSGVEKVVVKSGALDYPDLVDRLARRFGSQAVVVSIDVGGGVLRRARVYNRGGRRRTPLSPVAWAQEVVNRGAGELLVTSIDREGTWKGLDLGLLRAVTDAVEVPVIGHGGVGSLEDCSEAVRVGGVSAVAVGSMVVFQGKGRGVLVNAPSRDELQKTLGRAVESQPDPKTRPEEAKGDDRG
jgi:cyclase